MGGEASKPSALWHRGEATSEHLFNPKRPPKRARSVCADPEGSFALIRNDNADVFEFEPRETFMLAYAIDDQTSPRFKHRKLTAETITDARQVRHQQTRVGLGTVASFHNEVSQRSRNGKWPLQ